MKTLEQLKNEMDAAEIVRDAAYNAAYDANDAYVTAYKAYHEIKGEIMKSRFCRIRFKALPEKYWTDCYRSDGGYYKVFGDDDTNVTSIAWFNYKESI